MRLHFILNKGDNGPEALLAEVEVHFEVHDGPLAGLKLIGVGVWCARKDDKGVTVLVPSRSYATPKGARFFELLKDSEGDGRKTVVKFKKFIKAEYLKIVPAPDHD